MRLLTTNILSTLAKNHARTPSLAHIHSLCCRCIDSQSGELVQLLGPIGDYESELATYQMHFAIKPCKYPAQAEWGLSPFNALREEPLRMDCTALRVFSIDNASTRDIDDALSFEFTDGEHTSPYI